MGQATREWSLVLFRRIEKGSPPASPLFEESLEGAGINRLVEIAGAAMQRDR